MSSKWKENQTNWVSCHSVAIQQADGRMSQCSQTEITGHHVKQQRLPTKDLDLISQCDTKNMGPENGQTRQTNQNRQFFIENTNELKIGRKIRLTGYHATVLRSSRQSSACHNAVKRKLLDITSNIIVDQPGISTNNITVIPRTRGQAKTQVFR